MRCLGPSVKTVRGGLVSTIPTDMSLRPKALVSKFGTLSRAWRLGLDVDGSGKMDMREFCEVLEADASDAHLSDLKYFPGEQE